MKRGKRSLLRRIALGLAALAILAPAAQAKPTPVRRHLPPPVELVSTMKLGPGEIPYVSHSAVEFGAGEIPYIDDGTTANTVEQAPVATGDDYDIAFGLVSSAVIVLLLAGGLAIVAIRQTRKAAKLSPA